MFVTILTVIYSAIALFVLVRYARKRASRFIEWKNKAVLRYQNVFVSKRNNENEESISELQAEM